MFFSFNFWTCTILCRQCHLISFLHSKWNHSAHRICDWHKCFLASVTFILTYLCQMSVKISRRTSVISFNSVHYMRYSIASSMRFLARSSMRFKCLLLCKLFIKCDLSSLIKHSGWFLPYIMHALCEAKNICTYKCIRFVCNHFIG